MKLEMAKFLQDTIEETALQREDASGNGAAAQEVQEFVKFMDKVQHTVSDWFYLFLFVNKTWENV